MSLASVVDIVKEKSAMTFSYPKTGTTNDGQLVSAKSPGEENGSALPRNGDS